MRHALIALAVAALAVAACRRGGGSGATTAPDGRTSRPATLEPEPVATAPECISDEDCVLLPVLHCCGECPPAPPFEAVTRAELDAALIEDEQQCATEDHDCDRFRCETVARGCRARVACVATRCEAIASGC